MVNYAPKHIKRAGALPPPAAQPAGMRVLFLPAKPPLLINCWSSGASVMDTPTPTDILDYWGGRGVANPAQNCHVWDPPETLTLTMHKWGQWNGSVSVGETPPRCLCSAIDTCSHQQTLIRSHCGRTLCELASKYTALLSDWLNSALAALPGIPRRGDPTWPLPGRFCSKKDEPDSGTSRLKGGEGECIRRPLWPNFPLTHVKQQVSHSGWHDTRGARHHAAAHDTHYATQTGGHVCYTDIFATTQFNWCHRAPDYGLLDLVPQLLPIAQREGPCPSRPYVDASACPPPTPCPCASAHNGQARRSHQATLQRQRVENEVGRVFISSRKA